MAEEILNISGVDKSYGGVHALRGAAFSLLAGEVHALMGENGAGKSTLAKIIAGAVRPDRAEFLVDGKAARIQGPPDAQRLGISIIYQELDLFPHLTVAENMAVGNSQFPERGWVQFARLDRFAQPFLDRAGFTKSPRSLVSSLNIGEMQLLAIARALSMNARIVVMDEPTSSLFDDSVERLFAVIRELKRRNVAVIYVSHKMDEIFRICDRVTVMRDGATVATRPIPEITAPELIGMMVGRPWQPSSRVTRTVEPEPLLSVRGLSTARLHNISFDLRKGEVLGVAGLVGAGCSELGEALTGLVPLRAGEISLKGGISLLPQDRKLQGLMMQMSVLENATIAEVGRFTALGFIQQRKEAAAAEPLFRGLSLKAGSLETAVGTLSGGNQQKTLLARCLLAAPAVLFLDDPARGIDIGAKEDIYAIIERLAGQGKGIIVVSSELPELLRCCDRILVMREGAITSILDASATTQEEIMTFATRPVATQPDDRSF